jgi:hypothetical protein
MKAGRRRPPQPGEVLPTPIRREPPNWRNVLEPDRRARYQRKPASRIVRADELHPAVINDTGNCGDGTQVDDPEATGGTSNLRQVSGRNVALASGTLAMRQIK